MSSFAIKYPFFILMMCLSILVVGIGGAAVGAAVGAGVVGGVVIGRP